MAAPYRSEDIYTKLIELGDGTLVEVSATEGRATRGLTGGFAEKVTAFVDETFRVIEPILIAACRPIISSWQGISRQTDIDIAQAELELSFNFEAEGRIYLAKSKENASLNVKLVLKRRS